MRIFPSKWPDHLVRYFSERPLIFFVRTILVLILGQYSVHSIGSAKFSNVVVGGCRRGNFDGFHLVRTFPKNIPTDFQAVLTVFRYAGWMGNLLKLLFVHFCWPRSAGILLLQPPKVGAQGFRKAHSKRFCLSRVHRLRYCSPPPDRP